MLNAVIKKEQKHILLKMTMNKHICYMYEQKLNQFSTHTLLYCSSLVLSKVSWKMLYVN